MGAAFVANWVPNIVCSIVFLFIGWWLGLKAQRETRKALQFQTIALRDILLAAEERRELKLVRDKDGNITGGRSYEMRLETGQFNVEGQSQSLHSDPSPHKE